LASEIPEVKGIDVKMVKDGLKYKKGTKSPEEFVNRLKNK